MSEYKSSFIKLGDEFFKNKFNIPIYQRLYVWKAESQVSTLIEDLLSAFNHDSKKEYFLGGIVVVKKGDLFDLVDGQQRFTTLKILRQYILNEPEINLDFEIRDDIWAKFESGEKYLDADIVRMKEAKTLLTGKINSAFSKLSDIDKFKEYLREKVKLVVTSAPVNTDLNKLFELINGRGEQLKQHQILKAKLLSKLPQEIGVQYGKVWDICARMDNYLEINIKQSTSDTWKEHVFNTKFEELLAKLDSKHKGFEKAHNSSEGVNLSSLIEQVNESEQDNVITQEIDELDEVSTKYNSIISFELFLLYVLVLTCEDNYFERMQNKEIEFKDKNLIQIFEEVLLKNKDEVSAQTFIKNLFLYRKIFDDFVIKNHQDLRQKNDINHKIAGIKKSSNNGYEIAQRWKDDDKPSHGIILLQSMLYHAHTRNTQEWIIPFLKTINDDSNSFSTSKAQLGLLMKIDNYLYSETDSEGTILFRASSLDLTQEKKVVPKIIQYLELEKTPDNYNYFSHYWFYKMDWVIWYLSDFEKYKNFKFTSRNSIEHISPQTPDASNEKKDMVDDGLLNSFGNLALVSISQNSAFSNKGFAEKMGMFEDKEIKNLKIEIIDKNSGWGDDGCKKHLKECRVMIKKYFSNPI